MPDDNEQQKRRATYKQLYEASSLGIMFPLAIGIGFVIGWALDRKVFGTWPWLTVVFTAFGIIAAFVQLFRAGMQSDGSNGSTGNTDRKG